MFGQPASWQTVCSPSRWTSPRRCVNSGPIVALTLIHGGLRSMGVCALRASMRSILRPSGTTDVTPSAYVRRGQPRFEGDVGNRTSYDCWPTAMTGLTPPSRSTTRGPPPEAGEGAVVPRDPTRPRPLGTALLSNREVPIMPQRVLSTELPAHV